MMQQSSHAKAISQEARKVKRHIRLSRTCQAFGDGEQSPSNEEEGKIQKREGVRRRKINKKILKEIRKHVKDEAQQRVIVQMIEESMAKPAAASEIIVRNPSSWIKSLSSNFTWTNRELEWYFAEDRFLFAATNEDDCDRWVCIMNWLLARIAEERGDGVEDQPLYDEIEPVHVRGFSDQNDQRQ
eukprot:CAMPEP_0202962012 /NCGR_PEP_ID=MMETSP1396-20130829/6102_1 /ASSEMBLY_ACC=CAM_ASM_000872 /TAXON_ID= /ORGANISM="Pseudokeronopsis sp., Strain Brazil" /LENGTH=184 /DNA_ID=CAMNT_0049682285 /DNA_START=1541 /DNA_END=2097 /DNA_ORIENTATION=+